MRILIHDYAGHAFAVELSRSLAKRGHKVLHAYCSSTHSPRGVLVPRPDDADSLQVQALDLGEMIPKSGYLRRLRMESAYGRLVVDCCRDFQPEVVLSGNTPSIPQYQLAKFCKAEGVRHVFWVQDIYGLAAYKLLSRKLPLIGHAIGKYFISLDRRSAQRSDSIVVITEDFKPVLDQWGIDLSRVHVVENWSVLADLPLRPRENAWSVEQGLSSGPRFLYSGTLAMKHNPRLLLELAKVLNRQQDGEMIVISEGAGIEWLQREAAAANIRSLRCFPFQPFERMADVLGSGDVLVVILEADAGAFSVPSKALSYLCAGRAILGAVPRQNLVAKLVENHGAGLVVEPDDLEGFCQAAGKMLEFPVERAKYGVAARQYAEANFDLERITDRFEKIFRSRAASSPSAKRQTVTNGTRKFV